ncbi:hypothetical protein M758_2G050600 [Ceratodon purpureus]|uniref:Uncharacterized protein n=1 Tax=Ceratodon purpureus TaxID=3225 RepID=A0A8T0IQC1_CERPU|nr:hypothetical protein KC19_2G051700 [Ceratodon purpureus]KAG0625382.1 hypothetical protein M758_2G050600 [Ceratodon purpureus]
MRQPQVASSEGAPVSVSRKVTVKNGRREDPVGDEKAGDCLKLGNRRVLVKIPGNKVKVTTDTPQVKYSNDPAPKAPEVSHIRVGEQDEEVIDQVQKRPISDAVSLPQWGQRKRLRFNNRVDVKAAAEDTATDLKAIARGRGSVKAEKSPGVPTVRIKRPAVVPKLPPSPEIATGDIKRNVETSGATCTTQIGNHHVNGAHESEANTSRIAEVHSERPVATPEKVPVTPADSPAPLPAVCVRTGDTAHQDRIAHSEKVDMDLFQWPKFIVSLTRKEKEDDFFAIKGTKLPVRPKKRTKHLEKAVTFISPGAWLCDITRERYEVKEKKTLKKRPRGLKAMGSADSDTE